MALLIFHFIGGRFYPFSVAKEVPAYTAIFVKAMLIKSILPQQYGLGHLIDATGKVQLFKTVRSVLTLLSLPLAYMAFKMGYPPYTISYLYVGIALILFIANQYMLHKIIQFNTREFLLKSTLKILLICIMQIPIFILIRYFPSGFLRFFVFSIVCELILLASIYFLGIDKSEKQRIWQFIQSYIEKFKNKQQQGLADA